MARKKLQAKNPTRAGLGALRFDRTSTVPLYRQVYDRLRDLIVRGGFGAGARLPSSRSLASQLSLSRATVAYAYDLLAGDGYVGGRGSAGTYVSPLGRAVDRRRPSQPGQAMSPGPFLVGMPALDLFPRKSWARLEKRRAAGLAAADLVAPDPLGYLPLRHTVANRLAIYRGIVCDPSQVFVTSGYQGALLLAATALLKPGDSVWVEDPGYPKALSVLRALRARVVGVPVDEHGLNVRAGCRAAPRARLALATPCHQFPLGYSLSPQRRESLLDWAEGAKGWIVEDDYDNDYHYRGQPPAPLRSADTAERVIYVVSFSKQLFPGLRIACMVVPRGLVESFRSTAAALASPPATRDQAVLRDFIRRGLIGQHLNRMRRIYAARRDALLRALARQGMAPAAIPDGGLHLVAPLPRHRGDSNAAELARSAGLGATALSSCAVSSPAPAALLLGFTALPENEAEAAVARLARAIG